MIGEREPDTIEFDANFESGSMDRMICLGRNWYHLALAPGTYSFFLFRVRGCKGREIIFEFARTMTTHRADCPVKAKLASASTVASCWPKPAGPKPFVSYDAETWSRVDHMEEDPRFPLAYRFVHRFTEDEAYVCYTHPYTYSDMLAWVQTLRDDPAVKIGSIGTSRNGVDQPLLTITEDPSARDVVVLIAREDCDEPLGSWGIEGVVRRLLAPESRDLLRRYTFQIVPMVCVDGVIAGATHSAGYGYGGGRWHEEPAPDEIENVKRAARQWAGDGCQLALAGKLHAGMTLQPVHSIDMLTCDSELRRVMSETADEYWRPRERDLEIRPQGYFERFMLDDFGLRTTFATHVQGTSPENVRRCGVGMMRAIMTYLEQH